MTVLAIPPESYKGTLEDWKTALINRGLWDGQGWYAVKVTAQEYQALIAECEGISQK